MMDIVVTVVSEREMKNTVELGKLGLVVLEGEVNVIVSRDDGGRGFVTVNTELAKQRRPRLSPRLRPLQARRRRARREVVGRKRKRKEKKGFLLLLIFVGGGGGFGIIIWA